MILYQDGKWCLPGVQLAGGNASQAVSIICVMRTHSQASDHNLHEAHSLAGQTVSIICMKHTHSQARQCPKSAWSTLTRRPDSVHNLHEAHSLAGQTVSIICMKHTQPHKDTSSLFWSAQQIFSFQNHHHHHPHIPTTFTRRRCRAAVVPATVYTKPYPNRNVIHLKRVNKSTRYNNSWPNQAFVPVYTYISQCSLVPGFSCLVNCTGLPQNDNIKVITTTLIIIIYSLWTNNKRSQANLIVTMQCTQKNYKTCD